jgi:hypothetical protein
MLFMINLITRLSGILAILVLGFGCLASFSDQPGHVHAPQ